MGKAKYLFLVILLLLGLTAMTGCTGKPNNKEDTPMKYELSERQIALLSELDLPVSYDELNAEQKNAIISIENMLIHLEEKYAKNFCYLGYVPYSPAEHEHLIAYPADGTPKDAVTLYRISENGEFRYEDNYTEVIAKPLYLEAVQAFVGAHLDPSGIKVFCKMRSVDENFTKEEILKHAAATIVVFIDEDTCSREQLDAFTETCKQWLADHFHGEGTRITLRLTRTDAMGDIFEDNYLDQMGEDIFSADVDISINTSGTVSVH